ncbi:GntR family transcriptional regulator [Paenarthrobacter sp. NCHU4564]|uniref:GntR family transcriptional regulator n=1 Tax=Paenarthrobacter sp. NCHU4564 TaxID=3451353 RepID=UPI003F9E6FE9
MSLQIAKGHRSMTAQEFVLKTLRDALMDGTLAAGTRLVQSELAAQLEVSITPVREALRDLAAEGLVVITPNRGTLVKALDVDEVREIYELRCTLEPLMVRRIMDQVTVRDLARAQELHDEMDKTKDLGVWAELNREFHSLFSQQRDESRLAGILDQLRVSSANYVRLSLEAHPERIAASNDEHAELIQFYRDKNLVSAIDLTVRHLQSTITALEDSYSQKPTA